MITAGIDIGSSSAKIVIMKNNEIIGHAVIPTQPDSVATSKAILEEGLSKSNLTRRNLKYIVATGYGRVNVPYSDEYITEISCHSRGAHWFFPSVRTILDMGGQDCKAIRCNDRGQVTNYMMNDKCAAGTGRFLEIISDTLEIPLEEIGPLSLKASGTIPISSVCAVFARQEIISSLKRGESKENILLSLFESIATRVMGLVYKVGIESDFMVTGGIAKNIGILNRIQNKIKDVNTLACENPQIVGALGAAVFAHEHIDRLFSGN
ncbi:MAG: acyl-CoA dehydratase activase [Desulfobacterales bacterium]|jgi:predicted CoA-substrate-specific enzyme activase|nr:acyl-CoA dehydratase activase [Desulfobacterales bacterium]